MTREEFLKTFPTLITDYRPSPQAVSHIGQLRLLMIVGPSGVGKTSLINKLGLPYVPADITRPKRPDEQEGQDYHFRQDYDQIVEQIKEGDFVQTTIGPGGDFYSTIASAYPNSGTAVMAVVHNAINNFRRVGFKETISVFVVPPSFEEWMRRLDSHNLETEDQTKRLSEAAHSLEFALHDKQMHFVINDDLSSAVIQVKDILEGKINQEQENNARRIVQNLLESVSYNMELA